MPLHSVGEAEGIVQFETLKNIQSAAEDDLPSVVGGDVAVVLGARLVVFPRELDADARAGVGHLLKILGLAIAVELVFSGDDMNRNLILGATVPADGLEQLHQIALLVK